MHERLVESWLDSASERSYQAPFCQMLSAEGHRILHSTRHSSIELGKDVVTTDKDGVPCAYQLKGNPGGRLTLQEFRGIEPQLRQLTNLPVNVAECRGKPHRSFLVTNGYVEEETRLAIAEMNQGQIDEGYRYRTLELIQRGDLLDMAKRLGHSLWPTEIPDVHAILEMLVDDGSMFFPADRAARMLTDLLGLKAARETWSSAEVRRRVTSAAVMISMCLRNFDLQQNHFASAAAWVQYSVAVIAACERFGVNFNDNARANVDISLTATRDSLIDLAKEVLSRDVLYEGDAIVDAGFYDARYTLIAGLLSLLWLWCEEEGWPDDLSREAVRDFLQSARERLYLWGEGAVPQFLAYYWFSKRAHGGIESDSLLASLIRALAQHDSDGQGRALPGPYWTYDDVARHVFAPILGSDNDPLKDEVSSGTSYFVAPLLHLLVRANMKQTCRTLWPAVSRMSFAEFQPSRKWEYCLPHVERGDNRTTQPPLRKEWDELVVEARSIRCEAAPAPLIERPILLALWILLFPYRGTPQTVRRLAYELDRTWLLAGDPIDD